MKYIFSLLIFSDFIPPHVVHPFSKQPTIPSSGPLFSVVFEIPIFHDKADIYILIFPPNTILLYACKTPFLGHCVHKPGCLRCFNFHGFWTGYRVTDSFPYHIPLSLVICKRYSISTVWILSLICILTIIRLLHISQRFQLYCGSFHFLFASSFIHISITKYLIVSSPQKVL